MKFPMLYSGERLEEGEWENDAIVTNQSDTYDSVNTVLFYRFTR